MTKSIYEVREEIENVLRTYIEERGGDAKSTRVIVTVNPYNELDIMVVSPLFEGQSFDQRNGSVWPYLEERFPKAVLDRVNRWDILTVNEAKKVYPSTLKPRSSVVSIP